MGAYTALTGADIPTREAAVIAGVPRATATRKRRTPAEDPLPAPAPANRLSVAERAHILATVNSTDFIDLPPVQIYARLLDEGTYLCSISTFYRVLEENRQVKERRRQARHPARAVPELVATGPGQVFTCYADVVIMPMLVCDPRFQAVDGVKRSA
ncbi:helix-turn-helix domain-containing protein [Arthrobacter sp. U41]|uniref:helix-turn-helix domain-containing protein n=1 Tax=Arthrobacter sp. U41 TaxID=1849032 RepID=UPI0008595EDD|nr:helix-turn-helix domain-containing protein [Arthrobacter sp. U41]AOT04443.1 hypothetical protein ASPU41_15090 [Arthrobacter sp. U41]